MKYIHHRSHGISFYSIYSTKEISFFGPYKFLVKVSFPFFGGKRGLVMYKYCSCIFLVKIRHNGIMQFHAMNMQCQDLVLYYLPFFFKIYSSFSKSVVSEKKKKTNFFI